MACSSIPSSMRKVMVGIKQIVNIYMDKLEGPDSSMGPKTLLMTIVLHHVFMHIWKME